MSLHNQNPAGPGPVDPGYELLRVASATIAQLAAVKFATDLRAEYRCQREYKRILMIDYQCTQRLLYVL
jgi:hypothetical protein